MSTRLACTRQRRIRLLLFDQHLGQPLPLQDEIGEDESGNGYALRMLSLNGLQFSDLARATASLGHTYLPASAAPYLSYVFGAQLSRVSRAIPRTYSRKGRTRAAFMGNDFSRCYQLRHTRPQVCVQCLAEHGGRAKAAWEVVLYCACPKHRCRLIDLCNCGRPILWRRPSLYQCSCGADLRALPICVADEHVIELSTLIADDLFGRTRTVPDRRFGAISELSLDTLLRLVRTLGICASPDGKDLVPGKLTRLLSSEEAYHVALRAMKKIMSLVAANPEGDTVWNPSWNIEELLGGATQGDLRILWSLLGCSDPSAVRWFAHQRWQPLELLDEDEDGRFSTNTMPSANAAR